MLPSKEICCGCTACFNKCPKLAITMKEDTEGFLYPIIDKSKCINCGLCEKVCPIFNHIKNDEKQEAYIAYANEIAIRRESSSGGIFSLIAQYVLLLNGVVYGAVYDEGFRVYHIGVENVKDLHKLRGSKYTQSNLGSCYAEVKAHLAQNRLVLFSGTACQIAGLVAYLRKAPENLITIDILCHGVPSPRLWHQYVEYQAQKDKITRISQRNKDYGWKGYHVKIEYESAPSYCVPYWEDSYSKLFLGDVALRHSCYHCSYKDMERPSDITLGDCWGIEKYNPKMDDDMGTSVVVIHTEKGLMLYRELQNQLVDLKVNLDEVLPESAHSRKSVAPHANRGKLPRYLLKGNYVEVDKILKISNIERAKRKIKKLIRG